MKTGGVSFFVTILCLLFAACAHARAGDDAAVTVTIIDHPHLSLNRATATRLADILAPGDRIVTNGPLFGIDGEPVGGYISRAADGALATKPLVHVKGGDGNFAWRTQIFAQRADGSFFMQPSNTAAPVQRLIAQEHVVFMIQNGPALVAGGKNLHDPASAHIASRIGIGFTKDNRLIVADSQNEITMYDLAEALRGAGAVDAVYLDGNRNGFGSNGVEYGHMPRSTMLIHVK